MNDEYKDAWDEEERPPVVDRAPAPGPVPDPMGDDAAKLEEAFNEEPGQADPAEMPKEEAKPEFKSFAEAFRHHRANGDKVFEWKGKKYTTELKKAAKPVAKAPMGNEGRRESRPVAAAVAAAAPAKKPGAGLNLMEAARKRSQEMNARPQAPSIEQIRAANRAKAAQ
jgi:hypothetical protein